MTINYKEISQQFTELVEKYASDELKLNDRYYDILTNTKSIWENTDLVWKNFNKRSAEYKQTILNEKLTLEFLQIYNKTRDELNCYQSFGSHFYANYTGLIFYGFFHHLLSVYKNNKEIITEISKIIPLTYYVSFRNNKRRNYSLFDFISENLKNDSDFVESIINTILTKDVDVDIFFDITALVNCTNLMSNFDFLYKLNKKLGNLPLAKDAYISSIKPSTIEELEMYNEYAEKRSSFDELNIEINITPKQTPSKKKMKI